MRIFSRPLLKVVSGFLINIAAGLILIVVALIREPFLLTADLIAVIVCLFIAWKIEEVLEK